MPFVPAGFVVPQRLETPQFVLRQLRISDVVKDYDAVMSSVDHLRGVFGPRTKWPTGLTFEDDLIDLGWHHKEFKTRRSFAYTMMQPDEELCLGCAYIEPTAIRGYDAEAFCWVRASHADALDTALFEAFSGWVERDWPFAAVAWPGRRLSWEEVDALRVPA